MEDREIREKLDGLLTQYGSLTVKELLTSTGNIALPVMVQARALLQMKSEIDLREYAAKRVLVPKGAGKQVDVQMLTAPDYSDWTEGTALSAADPTVAKTSITVAPFGKVTLVSDLLQNTSAIDFVAEIGRLHGSCVIQGILDKCADALGGATGNSVSVGTKGDATEASVTFANVASAISAIVADGFKPNLLITAPDKFWTMLTTDWDMKMFYGSLGDFVLSGKAPMVMGQQTIIDPYFELAINGGSAWNGTNGEKYAIVATREYSLGWAEVQKEPEVEIYRLPTALSNYVVTHLDGAAGLLVDNSVCVIKHAA